MANVVEEIAHCETLPRLWKIMLSFFNDKGYGACFYFACGGSKPDEAPGATPVHHGFSPAVVNAYLAFDYQRVDIVHRTAMALGKPLRWSDAWAAVDTTAEEQSFLAVMRGVELGDGFTLPCYGPNGRDGYVGIGRMSDQSCTDAGTLREMHLSAQAAHLRICDLSLCKPGPDKALSAREREVLDWVARGKSNGVIADILSISAGTVDTYLRRIYDKLDVADRTSAAVRGVGMGLIAA
jgi:DNA-binding CsgD family transcriptional regulator